MCHVTIDHRDTVFASLGSASPLHLISASFEMSTMRHDLGNCMQQDSVRTTDFDTSFKVSFREPARESPSARNLHSNKHPNSFNKTIVSGPMPTRLELCCLRSSVNRLKRDVILPLLHVTLEVYIMVDPERTKDKHSRGNS